MKTDSSFTVLEVQDTGGEALRSRPVNPLYPGGEGCGGVVGMGRAVLPDSHAQLLFNLWFPINNKN